jgi:hypothetical protein
MIIMMNNEWLWWIYIDNEWNDWNIMINDDKWMKYMI